LKIQPIVYVYNIYLNRILIKKSMYLNWENVFVFQLKSGKAAYLYLILIWLSCFCIWSENMYLDTTLVISYYCLWWL